MCECSYVCVRMSIGVSATMHMSGLWRGLGSRVEGLCTCVEGVIGGGDGDDDTGSDDGSGDR